VRKWLGFNLEPNCENFRGTLTYTYGPETKQVTNRHAAIPPPFWFDWPLEYAGKETGTFNADWPNCREARGTDFGCWDIDDKQIPLGGTSRLGMFLIT